MRIWMRNGRGVVVCKRVEEARAGHKAFGVTTFRTSLRNVVPPLNLLAPAVCLYDVDKQ